MKVALLPTGKAELLGLAAAFSRRFPEHTFECLGRNLRPVSDSTDVRAHHGFTSSAVDPAQAADKGSHLRHLVASMAALVSRSKRAGNYDLVVAVAVDDLELVNREHPGRVLEAIRRAVEAHLPESRMVDRIGAELRVRLRERASFHFAVPMLEAWFFGDNGCLEYAPETEPPAPISAQLEPGSDPEHFATVDVGYLEDDGSACSHAADWAKGPPDVRRAHPKRYLQWLCRDHSGPKCTSYRESKGGVRCLENLNWGALLASPGGYHYLRALVEDLEEGLGEASTGPDPEAPTRRKHTPSGCVLRNV